ncbi:DinB family protein [Dinghuibacter silviterrae]|uniref:DinB family protein n=1 Tax=Dinghuibacter silviterrae TaxID=1539049 RepID=A0A4R8DPF8_9BACT|nr:DinB family protein [Dinghuibacter silviterrae]TDW99304.1 DinB family protein [Dinghuibacter silviterrae]
MSYSIPAGAYAQTEDVPAYLGYLKGHLAVFPAYMSGLSEEGRLNRSAPGKWSRQEILGHLVDSATYNLMRFLRAPLEPSPYLIPTYPQVELVRMNRYQDLPLGHVLTLWEGLNRQIIYVVEGLDATQLALPVQVRDGSLPSLGWLFCDYVAHLEHHLAQVYAR